MGDSAIRKQVFDLKPEDLASAPIWEFALDEEGVSGQDEATVRPRPELKHADPGEGLFVVRAEFVSADGTHFEGYVSPQPVSAQPELRPGWIQPTIVTNAGQVGFWLGAFPPEAGDVETAYATVGKSRTETFPLHYRSVVSHGGIPLEGELDGFMHLESIGSDSIVTLT